MSSLSNIHNLITVSHKCLVNQFIAIISSNYWSRKEERKL